MTLDELLADATRRGLTHLTLFRVGEATRQWQASVRFPWTGGYIVDIQPDPADALRAVLSQRDPRTVAAPAPTAAPAASASVFD